MNKWLLLALLASCSSTSGIHSSTYVSVTFPATGESSMRQLALGGQVSREFSVSEEGILLIRIEDHGVMLDLADFPGPNITTYFDTLDHMPLHVGLPDGTRFAFHGESFEVAGELYELPEGGGVVRYVHPGQVLSP